MNKNRIERKRKSLEYKANSLLRNKGVEAEVNVLDHGGCYTYLRDPGHGVIYIDLSMCCCGEDISSPDNSLRIEGALYHEIGHLLYTQMDTMKFTKEKELLFEKTISEFLKQNKKEVANRDENTLKNLKKLIINHIYYKNMAVLINILEDAAIEMLVPGAPDSQKQKNRVFAAVSAMRNYTFDHEYPLMQKKYKEGLQDYDDMLKPCLSEIHELGVIGYRMNLRTPFLEDFFNLSPDNRLDYVKRLVMKSKFATKNSMERFSVAQLILKEFMLLIDYKADKFINKISEALNQLDGMTDEDIENAMNSSKEKDNELGLTLPNMTSGASSDQKSEYQYDLSDGEEKKLEEQKEKDKKEMEENQNGSSNSQNSENNGNEESSEGASDSKENNSKDTKNKDSGNSDGSEKETKNSKTENNQESTEKSTPSDNSEKEFDKNKQNGAGNSDRSENINEEGETSENQNQENTQNNSNASDTADFSKKLPNQQELNEQVSRAIKEEKENIQKSEKKRKENELKEDIKEMSSKRKNGDFTPEKCKKDIHKNISTDFKNEKTERFSQEGRMVKRKVDNGRFSESIKKTSSEINKIKMYSAKAKRRNAMRKGKLSTSSLYRAGTDGKCFRQVQPGKKKKFRIALLIDESGSMMNGHKMEKAIETAYVLASSCQKSGIPVAVYGHCCNEPRSILLSKYIDYNEKTSKSLSRLFNISAGGNNRDGLAIYQTCMDLVASKKTDEKCVLMVLSDGMPYSWNYYGAEAEQDIIETLNMFKKIYALETIGITIETGLYEIEANKRIYGDNAVYVSDAALLPEKTVQLLKALVLK